MKYRIKAIKRHGRKPVFKVFQVKRFLFVTWLKFKYVSTTRKGASDYIAKQRSIEKVKRYKY